MRSRRATSITLAAAVLALAACGGDGDGTADPDSGASGDGLVVVATEYEFDPAELSIAADTAVEVTLVNEGIVEHDWTVDEFDVLIHTDAGESATATITASAGTYDVYCSVPGHRELGMEGVLSVG